MNTLKVILRYIIIGTFTWLVLDKFNLNSSQGIWWLLMISINFIVTGIFYNPSDKSNKE